jgi:hypothetical protein
MNIIIITILLLLGWAELFKQTFSTKEGFKHRFKLIAPLLKRIEKINITGIEGHEGKPFNCAYCLSAWIGFGLAIISMDLSYTIIFLYFAIKTD